MELETSQSGLHDGRERPGVGVGLRKELRKAVVWYIGGFLGRDSFYTNFGVLYKFMLALALTISRVRSARCRNL